VAQLLLDLADEAGSDKITPPSHAPHHRPDDRVVRETVSRTMRELVDKGYIEISRREILIATAPRWKRPPDGREVGHWVG